MMQKVLGGGYFFDSHCTYRHDHDVSQKRTGGMVSSQDQGSVGMAPSHTVPKDISYTQEQ